MPPSVPASIGCKPAGLAGGAHEADELGDHDQRPGRRLGHAEPVEHLAGRQPAIVSRPPAGRHRRARHRRRRTSPPPSCEKKSAISAEDVVAARARRRAGRPARARAGGRWPRSCSDQARLGRAWSGTSSPSAGLASDTAVAAGRPWPPPAAKAAEPALPPAKPIRPAARTISGNGTREEEDGDEGGGGDRRAWPGC